MDADFLEDVGLGGLGPADADSLLAHCRETLGLRVGVRVARLMSEDQLDEFNHLRVANDQELASTWLDLNCPNHKDIAREEFLLLRAELTRAGAVLLARLAIEES